MVKFHVLTILPEFFEGPFRSGVTGRALQSGKADLELVNLRDFTEDIHRTVDDRPYGGGPGMVLKAEPIARALDRIREEAKGASARVVLLSAQGRVFRQKDAESWAELDHLILICGRYEGVDERVALHLADEEISIGDFVISGGEAAAAVIVDAVLRRIPGVVGKWESIVTDSFMAGILGYPQYTRPAEFRGWAVPEVLAGGDHKKIQRWREEAALSKTERNRPDLLPDRHQEPADEPLG